MAKDIFQIMDEAKRFTTAYVGEYVLAVIIPIAVGIVGILVALLPYVLLLFNNSNPYICLVSLLSLPLIFWSFWRCYLIAYSLNFAAMDFLLNEGKKENSLNLFIEKTKQKGNELALWISYVALMPLCVLFIICSLPFVLLKFGIQMEIFSILIFALVALSFMVLLIPLYNFFNQAFFFKKENEPFGSLLLNCYKKLNGAGFLLILIIFGLQCASSCLGPLSSIVMLLFTPAIVSASAYWYHDRISEEK